MGFLDNDTWFFAGLIGVICIFCFAMIYPSMVNKDLDYAQEHGRQVALCEQCDNTEVCGHWGLWAGGLEQTYCLKLPINNTPNNVT